MSNNSIDLTMPSPETQRSEYTVRYVWLILALLIAASFFNYFDRVSLGVLKTTLKETFHLDDSGYALLVNAFTVCYAGSYIASGWFVDRFGARLSLTVFIALWSMVTIGCGLAQSLWQLMLMRALLGVAEPGLHPVSIRTATLLTGDRTRRLGRGLFMALIACGGTLGTIAAGPIIVWLTTNYHWRYAFVLPGIGGLVLAVAWWVTYRESQDTATPASSLEASRPPLAWSALWRQKALWGILIGRLLADPVVYFCVFWMYSYLQENKGVSFAQLGMISWIPPLAGQLGGVVFTALSDHVARRSGFLGRKRLAITAALFAPLCLLIPVSGNHTLTIALFCVLFIVHNCWMGSYPPIIAEIFPVGNVGSIWGIAGAFGASGAVVFNWMVGQATQWFSWGTLFMILACLHPAAALIMHLLIRPPHRER